MTAYYNEIDPYAAQWLRNLVAENLIAPGDVDTRDIRDIAPGDLAGYAQCHFFAGIGGWSRALRLAGVPDDFPVWTGSCPCQPFSQAGKGGGFADERHLWPYWHHLIRIRRPDLVLGEQVASPDGLAWFDLVHADLEGEAYAVGASDLCAAGVQAPHIRQRLWFVAQSESQFDRSGNAGPRRGFKFADCGATSSMEYAAGEQTWLPGCARESRSSDFWFDAEWLPCTDGKSRPVESASLCLVNGIRCGLDGVRAGLAYQAAAEVIRYATESARSPGESLSLVSNVYESKTVQRAIGVHDELLEAEILRYFLRDVLAACEQSAVSSRFKKAYGADAEGKLRSVRISDIDLGSSCQRRTDGQFASQFADALLSLSLVLACHATAYWKIAEGAYASATHPLANGVPARVAKLRALGNAIVPQVAAEFIKAALTPPM